MPHFLGLDSSTQSLTAVVLDTDTNRVLSEHTVRFGADLPEYGCPNGVLPNDDPTVAHSDPRLWVAALDLLLARMRSEGVALARVAGVSGAGQQHGSVYLRRAIDTLGGWDPARPLAEQVALLLSRATAPIWLDASTTGECREIAAAVGGDAEVMRLTGSRTIERFTGPQIRKFSREAPEAYAETTEIHLVSSFLASVLTGRSAPIDLGDGAGMNLLELATGTWSPRLLEATAPNLASRLRAPVPSATRIGVVAGYFVERYGFAPETPVFAFTGDNPSSLVGMGATEPGTAVVSLGTSDTVFAAMAAPRTDPRGFGHVFGNPAGGFLSLVCFANGSLAREAVRERAGLDWDGFATAVTERTRPGNDGRLMLPYFFPEMTPRLRPDVRFLGDVAFVEGRERDALVRAILEAQALTMRRHSDWIGDAPREILVTGGASRNPGILRVLADVFQARIQPLAVTSSCALGAAVRAAQAVTGLPWSELAARFSARDTTLAVLPDPTTRPVYDELGPRFAAALDELVASQHAADARTV